MTPTRFAPHAAKSIWLPPLRSGLLQALKFVVAITVSGCAGLAPRPGPPNQGASTPPPAPAAPAATPGAAAPNGRTAGAEALAIEQRWLQDWFRGTPVRIAQRSDGALAVDVPREFCFDTGRSQVKPALGAVLDKVAQSLRRRPGTRLTLLSAPGDTAGAPTTLALQRAAGVQRHLRDRGVALARLGEPAAEGSTSVQLRIATLAP